MNNNWSKRSSSGSQRSGTGFFPLQQQFLTLTMVTATVFLMAAALHLGPFGEVSKQMAPLPPLPSNVSQETYVGLMEESIPWMRPKLAHEETPPPSLAGFLFSLVTPFQLEDPRTLLGKELPGLASFASEVERDVTNHAGWAAAESPAPPDSLLEQIKEEAHATGEEAVDTEGSPPENDRNSSFAGAGHTGNKKVFIYHTHNRESFIPELEGVTKPDEAFSDKVNITQVGERLAQSLERHGIHSSVSKVDYWSKLNGKYHLSYAESRKTLASVLEQDSSFIYVFDIHRDALPREKTTVEINGIPYAAMSFVVGKSNKDWQKNANFAEALHEKLEEKHPGLSRGVNGKDSEGGKSNGEYNQSLHANNILVEIGGPYNSFEETYRSAEVLAEAIAELYWQAEAVTAPEGQKGPAKTL